MGVTKLSVVAGSLFLVAGCASQGTVPVSAPKKVEPVNVPEPVKIEKPSKAFASAPTSDAVSGFTNYVQVTLDGKTQAYRMHINGEAGSCLTEAAVLIGLLSKNGANVSMDGTCIDRAALKQKLEDYPAGMQPADLVGVPFVPREVGQSYNFTCSSRDKKAVASVYKQYMAGVERGAQTVEISPYSAKNICSSTAGVVAATRLSVH